MPNKFTVCFGSQKATLLDNMAIELGTTKAGTCKLALSLLTVAIQEIKNGNKICVIKGDQILKEIVGII